MACGIQLGPRDTLHVLLGRLALALRLQRLRILLGAGQQQLVPYTELVEQLAAPRALRGEIDEGVFDTRLRRIGVRRRHSRWYGWFTITVHAR